MFKLFSNAWKVKEVRNKILYTLLILAIVRLGAHIALPGIDIIAARGSAVSSGTLYNIIAGGYNSNGTIFALGIGPYITSSIIMQLLTVAIPRLEQLSKEGEDGRKKLTKYTRYLTVALSLIQGYGTVRASNALFVNPTIATDIIAVIILTVGSTFVMWLAEQITSKGITNGSSMIIFINIVSNMPMGIQYIISKGQENATNIVMVIAVLIILLLDIVFIVIIHEGERRLPVQYSSKMMGRHAVGGQSSYLPVKVSTAGVIAIIFAISLLQFPQMIGQFSRTLSTNETFISVVNALQMTHPLGASLYIILILLFSYFYTSIVINPNEIAENMKKNGGFIPGIRPGQPTSAYITRVVNRVTFFGAVAFSLIALVPLALQWIFNFSVGFGGTTLIIVVGVCLDIVKSLESQLLMRHYKGFLNS